MRQLPVWVIPAILIIFFGGLLIWLYATDKLPGTKTYPVYYKIQDNLDIDISTKKEKEKEVILVPTKFKNKYSEIIDTELETPKEENKKVGSRKEENTNYQENERLYQEGLIFFNQGNYQNAAVCFLKYIENSNINDEKKAKAKIYVAYSLYFIGISTNNSYMIEKSKQRFLNLYKEFYAKNQYMPQIVLGLAKASRALEEYPEGIDVILKETLLLSQGSVKRNIYLELGYYYFSEKDMETALSYFLKSEMKIANKKFFEILIDRNDTSVYLIEILDKKMVPDEFYKTIKIAIQQKALKEARRYFKNGKQEEGFFLLKKLISLFPTEPIAEEANFYLGEFYFEDAQYQKALYYYNQTLSNQYLDFDAQALFKKGITYYKMSNYQEALKNFLLIRENFVSSKYYQPALDWIKEIEQLTRSSQYSKKEEELKDDIVKKKSKREEKDGERELEELFFKEGVKEEDIY